LTALRREKSPRIVVGEGGSGLQGHLGIRYYRENGTARAVMNDLGFTYYDENGDVVWSTDCAPNC